MYSRIDYGLLQIKMDSCDPNIAKRKCPSRTEASYDYPASVKYPVSGPFHQHGLTLTQAGISK